MAKYQLIGGNATLKGVGLVTTGQVVLSTTRNFQTERAHRGKWLLVPDGTTHHHDYDEATGVEAAEVDEEEELPAHRATPTVAPAGTPAAAKPAAKPTKGKAPKGKPVAQVVPVAAEQPPADGEHTPAFPEAMGNDLFVVAAGGVYQVLNEKRQPIENQPIMHTKAAVNEFIVSYMTPQ
jgi:hypothetical protein